MPTAAMRSRPAVALLACLSLVFLGVVGTPRVAHADTSGVASESELVTALGLPVPGTITLGGPFSVAATELAIPENTVLDLNGHLLQTKSIVIEAGKTLTIMDGGVGGTLIATADDGAGIENTWATVVILGGTVEATGEWGAGIGGVRGTDGTSSTHATNGTSAGTVHVLGGKVTARGEGGAGIGGGAGGESGFGGLEYSLGGRAGGGGETIIRDAVVVAIGDEGAGIGGGKGGFGSYAGEHGGDGKTTIIENSEVTTIGHAGAGIGGGSGGETLAFGLGGASSAGDAGDHVRTTVLSGMVTATGKRGAGIGGGQGGTGSNAGYSGGGGNGGIVVVQAGSVTAEGSRGAGIGGGNGGDTAGGAREEGSGGHASSLTVEASAKVTARGSHPDPAVGPGNGIPAGLPRPVTLDGELVLLAGQQMTVAESNPITGTGKITGEGTIANASYITPLVYEVGDVTVTGNSFAVTFEGNSPHATPLSETVHVLATSFTQGARSFPTVSLAGSDFSAWNTQADGSGSPLTLGTTLTADLTVHALWDLDAYTMTPSVTGPLVGQPVAFTVEAVDGDPAGDLSSDFTFSTDAGASTISGNEVAILVPGTWTITATHDVSGEVVSVPVTVAVDRTSPAVIDLQLSSTSARVGETITASVTGTDAWGNALGNLLDLATITSDNPGDVIGADGSIRFTNASVHTITAAVAGVTATASVNVSPAATGGSGSLQRTGADAAPIAVLGIGLLLLGAAAVGLRAVRRR